MKKQRLNGFGRIGFLVQFWARAKKRGADPHDRSAFLNGHFKITAHAHAEMGQGRAKNGFALRLELAQFAKNGANFFRISNIRRDGHEAVNFELLQRINLLEFRQQSLRRITKLAGFARNVHFEEDGHGLGGLGGAFIDFRCQRQTVHALDHGEEMDGVAAFVGLQVADHMPAQLAGALADFDFGFLHAIFAEESNTEVGGGADGFGRLAFADGLEGDGFGQATGALAGSGEALPQAGKIFRETHVRLSCQKGSARLREMSRQNAINFRHDCNLHPRPRQTRAGKRPRKVDLISGFAAALPMVEDVVIVTGMRR